MPLVSSVSQLKSNMETIEEYINTAAGAKHEYALLLIKRGTCFIAHKVEGEFHFYPSRFIGYVNNTMEQHETNPDIDGRTTNIAISQLLNSRPILDDELELAYIKYCNSLGFAANKRGAFGATRKFWIV